MDVYHMSYSHTPLTEEQLCWYHHVYTVNMELIHWGKMPWNFQLKIQTQSLLYFLQEQKHQYNHWLYWLLHLLRCYGQTAYNLCLSQTHQALPDLKMSHPWWQWYLAVLLVSPLFPLPVHLAEIMHTHLSNFLALQSEENGCPKWMTQKSHPYCAYTLH